MEGRIVRADSHQTERLPEIGKIKIGEKRISPKTGKEYPVSLDYFIATGKYASKFDAVYGDKPSRILVVFPSNNRKEICNERYEFRDGKGKLLATGDGELWKVFNPRIGKIGGYEYNVKTTVDELSSRYSKSDPKFVVSVVLTIRFILAEVPTVYGVWSFSTKGELSSIPAMIGSYESVLKRLGSIIGVPFDLVVEKKTSQMPGENTITFSMVNLICNVDDDNLTLLADYIDSGYEIKGTLTEERIQKLVANKQLQLESHNEEIQTAHIVEETPIVLRAEDIAPPQVSQPGTVVKPVEVKEEDYLSKEEQEFMKAKMVEAGINPLWIHGLLTYKHIESIDKFPRKQAEKFFKAIESGQALLKAKEIAGIE